MLSTVMDLFFLDDNFSTTITMESYPFRISSDDVMFGRGTVMVSSDGLTTLSFL